MTNPHKPRKRVSRRKAQHKASPAIAAVPAGGQPAEWLSFGSLRSVTGTQPADAIEAGFLVLEGIATYGQPGPPAHVGPPFHVAAMRDSHRMIESQLRAGRSPGEVSIERRALLCETYRHLAAAHTRPWVAVSWVYSKRQELAGCGYIDAILTLGPVKAEWLGRALEAMEGDPAKLASGEYQPPPCGGCGCYLNKPRLPTPQGFVDCRCCKKNGNGCDGCKAKMEREGLKEKSLWLRMRKWKAAGEDE